MGPFLFAFLVAWFVVYRLWGDTRTVLCACCAWFATRTATLATAVGHPRAAEVLVAVSVRMGGRTPPGEPRTSDGQDYLRRPHAAAGARRARALLRWLWLTGVDAVGAARNARRRPRRSLRDHGWRRYFDQFFRWPTGWWTWPGHDEPHAPIRATSTRLDRDPPPDPTPGIPPVPPTALGTPPPRRTTPPGGPMPTPAIRSSSSGTVASGEGGLGSYMEFARGLLNALGNGVRAAEQNRGEAEQTQSQVGGLASDCAAGIIAIEGTVADMRRQDWSGPRVAPFEQAADLLGSARDRFGAASSALGEAAAALDAAMAALDAAKAATSTGLSALEGSVNVADGYASNPGTGSKSSVTNL
ncbi:hypothetical protein [Actinosynnema mirum]|uniref:Uncharacterized protein n=1 Tax=Actinosynnema mirum (strain ATCC 29888 / DSM 43827 / JCM 3225 / NBRC 14064 / NCIMB 13271 / NRRL B-12336 / IMRU 3971 / 101) TaxID=446462 RepID=C6WBC0_ACTMD|nr:hypothetical protein [Actinosynnema mirum]ACU39411.1 hypothetical protein Amir_5593 [Actinosynnema mirum DSM 43827]